MARSLVRALERGDQAKADDLVRQMACNVEASLFQEVGKLTRQLHDTLISVEYDARLAEIAGSDLPSAEERLNYVIAKTEDAAHRTINAVEDLIPRTAEIRAGAEKLLGDWSRFTRREMGLDEFKDLCLGLSQFLEGLKDHSSRMHGSLSEVLMAQDYQDLTGQVIRKVIALVQEMENKLVELVRLSGGKAIITDKPKSGIEAEGPQVSKKHNGQVVTSQDEVDGLLSSLGF
jgi:chemotaxis protein CheZ